MSGQLTAGAQGVSNRSNWDFYAGQAAFVIPAAYMYDGYSSIVTTNNCNYATDAAMAVNDIFTVVTPAAGHYLVVKQLYIYVTVLTRLEIKLGTRVINTAMFAPLVTHVINFGDFGEYATTVDSLLTCACKLSGAPDVHVSALWQQFEPLS